MGHAVMLPKGSFTFRIHLFLFSRLSNGRNHKTEREKKKFHGQKALSVHDCIKNKPQSKQK
jgi:hypothetical protein